MKNIVIEIDGEVVTYDLDAYTATVSGSTRVVTDQERTIIDATKQAQVAEEAERVQRAAAEQAAAERAAALAAPIAPLPIEGSTVAEVKASAETAIADLATQMQAKIDAILGNS